MKKPDCPNGCGELITKNSLSDGRLEHLCLTCGHREVIALRKVDEVFAFLIMDADGNEFIPMVMVGDKILNLVSGTQEQINSYRAYAEHVGRQMKQPIRLCRFTTKEQIAEFKP